MGLWNRAFALTTKKIAARRRTEYQAKSGFILKRCCSKHEKVNGDSKKQWREREKCRKKTFHLEENSSAASHTAYGATISLNRGFTCAAARLTASHPPPSALTSKTLVTNRC